ncbi:MAG: hypothetical protein PUD75_02115 [Prevotella sp.]|nr:hypothetical protein [Prevotella sp.]MDD6819166.1 hypothetical protein [Prevotella sp.]OYP57658.1 hypothetical protein CIK99_06510 [Prevotella sp. P5-92]
MAQNENEPFKGYYYNDEYNIYLKIDLHSDGLIVPEHEMFGKLPGYLGKKYNSFYWLITTKDIKNKKKAIVEFINDYGSEDLEASLSKKEDGTIILKQLNGSDLKVPNNGKWQKIPKEITLKKK